LIGIPPTESDPAGLLLASVLPKEVRDFLKSQPEHLDEDTLQVDGVVNGCVTFKADGYASDHEASGVFPVTVRGAYAVGSGYVWRLD
jgi:hypothetical protein